jgi:uncharacterized protein YndB with AHSA1/START domain
MPVKASRRKPKLQTLTFKQTINAAPEEVSRMFTGATSLRDWLSDGAQMDATLGGVFQLRWNVGSYVSGQFLTYEPGKKLVLSWDGKDLPAVTRVTVTFKPKGTGTQVTLAHSGIGTGSAWAGVVDMETSFWQNRLENLKSVIETGADLRIFKRPRLGLGYDALTPEFADRTGVPVKAGIVVTGTAEGTGARAVGLEKDDVLVKFNNKTVTRSLDAGMQGLKAQDTVPVEWYRGKEKMKGKLQLGTFPIPSLPATATDLAEISRKQYAELAKVWDEKLAGLSEAQAEHTEGNEWSVKDHLAHHIAMERDYQSWLSSMVRDNPVEDTLEMRPATEVRLRVIVDRYKTIPALLAEMRAAQAETVAFLANLSEAFVARRHLYWRAALLQLDVIPTHFYEEHGEQLDTALAAAKK